MAVSNTSYIFRVRNGQFDAALDMLKEMKRSLKKFDPQSVRAYYASAAGDATGVIILSVEHDSAESAGKAADVSWVDSDVRALSSKAASKDSPLEAVSCGIYTEIDL